MSRSRDLSNPDMLVGITKTATIIAPTSSDSFTLFWTNTALTIAECRSVITGATSATFTLYSGADRSGASNTVIQSGIVCSNVTSGNLQTSFSNANIAANSFVWISVTAVSGSPTDLSVALRF